MLISRKKFVKQISVITLGFISFSKLAAIETFKDKKYLRKKLLEDPSGILSLQNGFKYRIISKHKDKMDDGLLVPNKADGMGCFKVDDNKVILIRNHEIGHFPKLENIFKKKNPFGKKFPKYFDKNKSKIYDKKKKYTDCFGCTTTMVYNMKTKKIEKQFLSLAGTLVNCSGGQTPWNSWITCEETVVGLKDGFSKDHGYNFEVPANMKKKIHNAKPLKAMGRFKHEAIAVDPINHFIYQTEDREDGLFYRFLPNEYGSLQKGGKLEALSLKGFRGTDCSNWNQKMFDVGQKRVVKWVSLDNVDNEKDDLRIRGKAKGGASFARGEGLWYANDYVYFTATTGGKKKKGQIWRYKNLDSNGFEGELELFYESVDKKILNMPDNITVTPWGDVLVSEDGKGNDRLVLIKNNGDCEYLAENIFNKSEFAGAVFSPDGKVLFVNIYNPTMTIAIEGPWNKV